MTEKKSIAEAPKNTPDVINLEKQDLNKFTTIEKQTTKNILAETRLDIADENEQDISEEFGKYLNTLSQNTDWAITVPSKTKEINEQEKISNVLSMGAMLPIADIVEHNVTNNIETNTENLTISALLLNSATNLEKNPNITKNLELLKRLNNIPNPREGSIAYSVQNNWPAYSSAIQEYSEHYLAKKNEFKWDSNMTGTTFAVGSGLKSLHSGNNLATSLLYSALAGIVAKVSDDTLRGDKNISDSAREVFTDGENILNTGTKFLADYYTNENTSDKDKAIGTAIGLAGTALAFWKGADAIRGLGKGAKNMFSGKKKNTSVSEDGFFEKHWGKLGLGALGLIAYFLPKEWADRLKAFLTPKKSITDTAKNIKDEAIRETGVLENIKTSIEKNDTEITELNKKPYIDNLTALSKSEDSALKEQAKKTLKSLHTQLNKTGIIFNEAYIQSLEIGVLATHAKNAGYTVDMTQTEDNKHTLILTAPTTHIKYNFTGVAKDILKNNDGIEKTKEQEKAYREEDKETLIQEGMDNLIQIVSTKYETSDTNINNILTIAYSIKNKKSAEFTPEVLDTLQAALKKINAKITYEKEQSEMILTFSDTSTVSIGINPNISDEKLDVHKDLIGKNIVESLALGLKNHFYDVSTSTMTAMLAATKPKNDEESDPIYDLLTEYQVNGNEEWTTPEFFLQLGNAITKRNKETNGTYDKIGIALDGTSVAIILPTMTLWTGLTEGVPNMLYNSWTANTTDGVSFDGDTAAKGLGESTAPALFIGSIVLLKLADSTLKKIPIVRTVRPFTTKIPAKILYDLPVGTVKFSYNTAKVTVNGVRYSGKNINRINNIKILLERKRRNLQRMAELPSQRFFSGKGVTERSAEKFINNLNNLLEEKSFYQKIDKHGNIVVDKATFGAQKRFDQINEILKSDATRHEWDKIQKELDKIENKNPLNRGNIKGKENIKYLKQYKGIKTIADLETYIKTNNPYIQEILNKRGMSIANKLKTQDAPVTEQKSQTTDVKKEKINNKLEKLKTLEEKYNKTRDIKEKQIIKKEILEVKREINRLKVSNAKKAIKPTEKLSTTQIEKLTTSIKTGLQKSGSATKEFGKSTIKKIDNGIENQKNKFIENNVKSLTKKYSLSAPQAAQLSSFGGKLVNSIGVVATLSIMNNIADANNPYSEISKQAVTSSLFILGARFGSTGGIYGTIAGTAIAGMVTIFWGDKAGEAIETYFKEQEAKADKADKSADYMNDADRISSIAHIADAGFGDVWDATAGSIFTGENAYKYFSDTNKGFTHGFTYENYFHRGKEKVKYWNNEIAEKINDRKNTTKEYKEKFLSFDSSVQNKIIEKYSKREDQTPQFIKNKIDEFRKVVRSRTDTKLSNTPEYIYLQWKNTEFKEKLLSDQIIEKDGKWIQQQAGELQTEYENLLTLNEKLKRTGKKTSLKYLRALKAFIIHYRTLQNLELFNNAIDILSNSFPNDKHKGLKLTQNMLHFITELGNKENQKNLPEEIIELIGR